MPGEITDFINIANHANRIIIKEYLLYKYCMVKKHINITYRGFCLARLAGIHAGQSETDLAVANRQQCGWQSVGNRLAEPGRTWYNNTLLTEVLRTTIHEKGEIMKDYKEAVERINEIAVDLYGSEVPENDRLIIKSGYEKAREIARYAELRELNKNLDRIATALEGKAKE